MTAHQENVVIDEGDEAIGAGMLASEGIRDAILKKFPRAENAVLFEVRNAAGHNATRSADCMVMSLWPSRGLSITGIEIKISRSDFQREMKQPAKAEAFAQYCDWWYVAAPKGMLRQDELPLSWGLMEVTKRGIVITKEAARLAAGPIDRNFVAAMLKRAQEQSATAKQVADAHASGLKEGASRKKWENDQSAQRLKDLQEQIKAFEEASGIRMDSWDMGNVGEAVRLLRTAQAGRLVHHMESAANTLRANVRDLDAAVAVLKATKPTPKLVEV